VNNEYDRLLQLMIYDRIKFSLPSYLARHILSLEAPLSESGGWLGRQGLIDALDAYVAMSKNLNLLMVLRKARPQDRSATSFLVARRYLIRPIGSTLEMANIMCQGLPRYR